MAKYFLRNEVPDIGQGGDIVELSDEERAKIIVGNVNLELVKEESVKKKSKKKVI